MRIGIDIGGTFTDIVCVTPEGSLLVRKVPSTPDDYSRSVLECLPGIFQEAGSGPGQVQEVIHGTTVATNALLQGSGARHRPDHHPGVSGRAGAAAHPHARALQLGLGQAAPTWSPAACAWKSGNG